MAVKKQSGFLWTLGAALVVLLAIGSFFDYAISQALYDGSEHLWGQILAALGEMPAFLGIAAGSVFFLADRDVRGAKNVLLKLVAAAVIVVAAVISYKESCEPFEQYAAPVAVLTAAAFAATVLLFFRAYCVCDRGTALRFALTVLFVCIATLAVVNGVKLVWGRPRMRFLSANEEAVFQNWWQPSLAQKKLFTAQGVDKIEFRSFPSGHTAGAACSILLMLLPRLRGKGCAACGFGISVLFTAAVAFSRICMGAHFLSDVTLSWAICLALYALGEKLFYSENGISKLAFRALK